MPSGLKRAGIDHFRMQLDPTVEGLRQGEDQVVVVDLQLRFALLSRPLL